MYKLLLVSFVMSNVLELLQKVNPAINESMADDLRAGLVAINRQVQVDSASTDWSLNSWWQWLDDEGYDREAFLGALNQLCAAKLSDLSMTQLADFCRSSGDESAGLQLFQV